jgi:hypothetical protein
MGKRLCARIAIWTINIIFLLAGAAVMSFGIVILADPQIIIDGINMIPGFSDVNYIINVEQAFVNSGIALTVIGSVVFVTSLIGLIGSCAENKGLLIAYMVLNVLTLLTQLALIIYVSVDANVVKSHTENLMFQSLEKEFEPVFIDESGNVHSNSSKAGAAAWQNLQFKYGCCGAAGFGDFAKFDWQIGTQYNKSQHVPPSCCSQKIPFIFPEKVDNFVDLDGCLHGVPTNSSFLNIQNCYQALVYELNATAYTIATFACLIALQV